MELTVSLEKKLRDFTLRTDFTVKNEVFALLGASGCGKSMTLKCIAGIERPDKGRIVLDGEILFDSGNGIDLPPQKRQVGYLFQNYALFPNMTVAENLRFVMKEKSEDREKKIQELLERFHLAGLENAYPAALSGGQQQRAAFARILAARAKLLLLDEPFSALDSYLKWQLETELMDLLPAYDKTALLVSHDRGEVYRLADKIAIINRGQLEPPTDKKELFRHPRTLAATLLTGCKNISAATREDESHIRATEWGLVLKTAETPPPVLRYAGIRAHFMEPRESAAGENIFPMEAVRVIEDTFSYIVMVRPQGSQARPLRWELDKERWREIWEKELFLYFPPEHIMLMER
ncbi:MAG: ATP-binding cassette domain-containing protein [Selenomonadaceae bacterium]|nr:ATP-binding cassette domain-containing protein [Selenomonadaceae bacterium]